MIEGRSDLLRKLEEEGCSKKIRNLINAYFRYSEFMFNAPVIMVVGTVTDVGGFSKRLFETKILPKDKRGETDLDMSVKLSLKGFILKGEALGLGTCILTAPLVFLQDIEKRIGIEDVPIKLFSRGRLSR